MATSSWSANGVAMLANGPTPRTKDAQGRHLEAPFEDMKDIRSAAAFFHAGGGAMPVNSNGLPWNGDVRVHAPAISSLDLLHNFFLECGARMHKLRVYETLSDPTGREVCGYLLVRGSVHAHSYALALKQLTGVEMEKMLPTPNIDLSKDPGVAEVSRRGLPPPALHLQRRRLSGHGRDLGPWRNGASGRSAGRARSRRRPCRTAARSTS